MSVWSWKICAGRRRSWRGRCGTCWPEAQAQPRSLSLRQRLPPPLAESPLKERDERLHLAWRQLGRRKHGVDFLLGQRVFAQHLHHVAWSERVARHVVRQRRDSQTTARGG